MFNYYAIIFIDMVSTAITTTLGSPSIMTPLAGMLAEATGWSIETVLMLQVPTWMFIPMPYELPAMLVAMSLGGVTLGQTTRLLFVFTLFGVLVAIPLQFLWLVTLGHTCQDLFALVVATVGDDVQRIRPQGSRTEG